MANITKAQLFLESAEMLFPYYFNTPEVSQELHNTTMDPHNINVPDWNKGGGHDWSEVPVEMTLRGSRGFVNASTERADGSAESGMDYNPTGHTHRPRRLAERLLMKTHESRN